MRRDFYARCRLNCGTTFHSTGFCSAAFHSNAFRSTAFAVLPFTVMPCTVLVCNSCLGGVCFPLYARDSIYLVCRCKDGSMLSVDL